MNSTTNHSTENVLQDCLQASLLSCHISNQSVLILVKQFSFIFSYRVFNSVLLYAVDLY